MGFMDAPPQASQQQLRDWLRQMRQQGAQATPLPDKDLIAVLAQAIEHNKSLPTLVKITSPVVVAGDIHGHLEALLKVFEVGGGGPEDDDPQQFLFLGDIVDRGSNSVEVITMLLLCQLVHPRKMHLLRGNHETVEQNTKCGFRFEVGRKYVVERQTIYDGFNHLFDHFPLAALINGQVLCMHGGIPRGLSELKTIDQVKRPVTRTRYGQVADDLLWSDPTRQERTRLRSGFTPNTGRLAGHYFTETALTKMMQTTGVRMVVRAHQAKPQGFEYEFGGRLLTVFSSYNYCGKGNKGAVAVFNNDGGPPTIRQYGPIPAVSDQYTQSEKGTVARHTESYVKQEINQATTSGQTGTGKVEKVDATRPKDETQDEENTEPATTEEKRRATGTEAENDDRKIDKRASRKRQSVKTEPKTENTDESGEPI